MTEPTAGFGLVLPSPLRASFNAACMNSSCGMLIPLLHLKEVLELVHELLYVPELPVDRGEPHVSYLVEALYLFHHGLAHGRARYLPFARVYEPGLQPRDRPLRVLPGGGAPFSRPPVGP